MPAVSTVIGLDGDEVVPPFRLEQDVRQIGIVEATDEVHNIPPRFIESRICRKLAVYAEISRAVSIQTT